MDFISYLVIGVTLPAFSLLALIVWLGKRAFAREREETRAFIRDTLNEGSVWVAFGYFIDHRPGTIAESHVHRELSAMVQEGVLRRRSVAFIGEQYALAE